MKIYGLHVDFLVAFFVIKNKMTMLKVKVISILKLSPFRLE